MTTTIEQALILLRDNGDKPLTHLNDGISPRPSDVLQAMKTQRALSADIRDDEGETYEMLPATASAEDVALSDWPNSYSELHVALSTLTSLQEDVILLKYFQGIDTATTARILGCTRQNVEQLHSKALAKLREELT